MRRPYGGGRLLWRFFWGPGTYEWYCPIDGHKTKGMVGKLTVK